MTHITRAISIGPFASVERAEKLCAAGITHALNVSDAPSGIVAKRGSFASVAWVPMSDSRRLLDSTAVRAISQLHELVCVPEARVYLHCIAEMIRSPTILWLYLIACGHPPKYVKDLIESRASGVVAGHPQMVTDDHIALAVSHGRMHFRPHPRAEVLAPHPPL
jgi:hypothetical protein